MAGDQLASLEVFYLGEAGFMLTRTSLQVQARTSSYCHVQSWFRPGGGREVR